MQPAHKPGNVPEFSVGEISLALKKTVESAFERVRVRGEISGLSRPASGHVYFKLKDQDAVIDAVCWKFSLPKLALKPEDGLEIVATGKISTYPGNSRYQIIVDAIEMAGIGALLKQLEERKKKLAAEGLFDESRKKKIPYLPRSIGVITSPTGAVIRDILHRLQDRFPRPVLLWPVPVQGTGAAEQIAAAIEGFNALAQGGAIARPDVLIVARGGGSIEDLWEFNSEIVARAAAASKIPLISAVGHETDFTLIDFAADLRAPTPTAAAELAVPVKMQLLSDIAQKSSRISSAIVRFLANERRALQNLARALPHPRQNIALLQQNLDGKSIRLKQSLMAYVASIRARFSALHLSPKLLRQELAQKSQKLEFLKNRLRQSAAQTIARPKQKLDSASALLQSLSYINVLERGFAVVRGENGEIIARKQQWKKGEGYIVEFADGKAKAKAD